jgi:hypothetical protein
MLQKRQWRIDDWLPHPRCLRAGHGSGAGSDLFHLDFEEMQGATMGEDDPQTQSAPGSEFDQRVACKVLGEGASARLEARRAAIARREQTRACGHWPALGRRN